MSRALVFDCDGVLADTERDGHLVAFNRLFAELGLDLEWSPEEYARLLQITGGKERLRSLFADASWVGRHHLPRDPSDQGRLVAAWHRRKTAIFLELVGRGAVPARPGVARLTAEAQAAGWQVAVASTAADVSVHSIVEHVFPAEVRTGVRVFAGDVVKRKKPAADIYLLALAELGRLPGEACVVEDSGLGLLAARHAGCATVITVSDFTAADDFSGAALVVDSLGDEGHPARVRFSALPRPPGPLVTLAACEDAIAWAAGGTAGPPGKGDR
ncbi:MAG: haloacid dehalogenase [Acidobacteria bacterium]|nr:haloacid dehalogenase [Acidobacteriota bacterium]